MRSVSLNTNVADFMLLSDQFYILLVVALQLFCFIFFFLLYTYSQIFFMAATLFRLQI